MTLVLDSHGVTMLAQNRARLEELRRRGEWPAIVPTVVSRDPGDLRALARHTTSKVRIGSGYKQVRDLHQVAG